MNNVDKQYLDIMKNILDNGVVKETRSGLVRSIFGATMRFHLKDGLPLLTTKKVFYRGIIEELIWFLSGDTNIKYLVEKNVHIWDADAYRFYQSLCEKSNVEPVSMDEFLDKVKNGEIDSRLTCVNDNKETSLLFKVYIFGELGPIYGYNWRNYGGQVDQVADVIDKLTNNPNDRRILIDGYNPASYKLAALPPCHLLYQFYTRPLSNKERCNLLKESSSEFESWSFMTDEHLDKLNVPKYELSCMQYCRSQDFALGTCFNIAQVSIFTHLLANICNMTVGDVIWNGGDCHIYENQVSVAKEQLTRKGKENLPQLKFNRKIEQIEDFKYEDISIMGYEYDPPLKYPLSVG